ncbi:MULTISPECIES: type II toxin-antitoxin system RelE/ParE family toxin [Tenacibaculum]|nr:MULTISPECIES: type II toxin-antitoxin system RelE/ParE family toxin [Tenacibaculum]MCD8445751.1 type II toxin-antitoxin system RelE/ParE family toxin [Tenacibaculum finnmarkense genomovar ulcerans]MCG8184453.1 type II toxin-antitoxin system RelE/ParE family toxin [Tenacibaculum piscium]MCG8205847.1 type II toxin-antitoxin system RelE/ParE family toxin [Tenacibaculum piscium]MCG8236269.1 type II toxin-antitoxin system RelE/ParE family toxin [Tenacibaculum finnmarkense genomovar ulcerans]MCG8
MKPKFEVIFLEQAIDFMSKLDTKAKMKIYYNLDKAKLQNDPKLFKKLTDDIWEFRTLYQGIQYRLFAFWDKTDKTETLVLSTHGMIKKVSKVPKAEIEKALKIKTEYFNE